MSLLPNPMRDRYSPLYFLASLGAGGLSVTFFMFLMFWVPHPGLPVPVFEDIIAAFQGGGLPLRSAIVVALAGVAIMGFMNIRLLVWNLRELSHFKRTDTWTAMEKSNAETQVMAAPLAMAMTVNVGFILGLVFVPGLWSVVEYLFPLAMAAFLTIGIYAMRLMARFLGRVLTDGGFDMAANNSFAQMLPAFAFAMVGVGLAAPVAMSLSPLTAGIAISLSLFFVTIATLGTIIAMVMGLSSILQHGTAREAAPTLMVVIPILTVLGIAWMRLSHGLHVNFDVHTSNGETLVFLARILSLQVMVGLIGVMVLRAQGYVANFINRDARSAGAYALVCPGVALNVMLHFFINKGLVANDLIAKFGVGYWTLTAIAIGLQVAMILLMFRLNAKLLSGGRENVEGLQTS